MEYTPENITSLQANEIFVFGANQYADHAGGAAKIARERFGALNGIAPMGLCYNTYGIVTTSFNEYPVSLHFIQLQIEALYEFARIRPDLKFYVTKIGTGIAGFTIDEMRDLFYQVHIQKPNNIILPKEFTV